MKFDGLSLSALIKELNSQLTGGRVDKIFQPDIYTLTIGVRNHSQNLRLVLSAQPEKPAVYLTDASFDNPATAPSFCMLLRKHLEDGRIASVSQSGLDRVIHLDIDVRSTANTIITKTLIIELMGKHSNIICINPDGTILDSIRHVGISVSRYRQVLPGRIYASPPNLLGINILLSSPGQIIENLLPLNIPLEKAIVQATIGIGPVTARELAHRAGITANKLPSALTTGEINSLTAAITEITDMFMKCHASPHLVKNDQGQLLAMAAFPLHHLQQYATMTCPSFSQAVQMACQMKKSAPPEKELLTKTLHNELSRLNRKKQSIMKDIAEAGRADEIKNQADSLMTNLHLLTKGLTKIELADPFAEHPASKMLIHLRPEYTPIENAQHYYARYSKFKRAQSLLDSQLKQCARDIDYLESIEIALQYALTAADLKEIRQELIAAGIIQQAGKQPRQAPPASEPRKFTSDGFTVLIGKNNHQNDLVTFRLSSTTDLWFHTKDIPGSHVILRTEGRQPSDQAITDAAHLAAYFSKARTSAKVPVDYTLRRHVKKPSGAKPGFVIYDHHSTLYVTPDIEKMQLLE